MSLRRTRPPGLASRDGPLPEHLTSQTEDVLVDSRGYIDITDKNQELWVVYRTQPQAKERRRTDYG